VSDGTHALENGRLARLRLPGMRLGLRRRARAGGSVRRSWVGVVWVLPALALFGLFIAYPIVETFRLSLFDWDGLAGAKDFDAFDNFTELAGEDPFFWQAVKNTALWAAVSVPLTIVIGLALALALDRSLRFRNVYRTAFFIPVVMSSVVISAVWTWLYNPEFGFLNSALGWFGIGEQIWLGDPSLSFWSALAVSVWRWSGLTMLFFLAGLQTVPPELYQAAKVDGASEWAQIRRITLPLLKPMTALLVLLGTIGAFKDFEIIYILTGGGPAHSTDLLSIQIFDQGFKLFRSGYAAAISTILLVATALVALVQLEYLARKNRELA
jgi:raffinose/stachyose/melibiose transport system permease protein